MAIWHSKIMQDITNGITDGEWAGNGLVINSKDILPGDIFVALPGSKTDGHEFVKAAKENGAAAAIVNKKINEDIPQLIVPDVYEAVIKLSAYKRQTVKACFIGITGSVGKTTTKEILAKCLAEVGIVFATKGNFNGQLGLPLTMASIPDNAEYVICELGMSMKGEMTNLALMLKPDYVIITNIAAVHKEFFATVSDIALAKAEVFNGMKRGSTAILNADNDYYHILKKEAEKAGINVIDCGNNGIYEISKLELLTENNSQVEIKTQNGYINYKIATNSHHLIANSLLTLALLDVLKTNLNKITKVFASISDYSGRGDILKIEKWGKQITIIDDSYNSSPESLRAALKRLNLFNAKRKIAVLSDMLELGDEANNFHLAMLKEISNNDIDKVITYGDYMKNLYLSLPAAVQMYHAETLEDLESFLAGNIESGDLALFKGSHGTGLYKLMQLFKGV